MFTVICKTRRKIRTNTNTSTKRQGKKKSLAHKKSEKNKTETTNLHERTLKTIATDQTKKENRKLRPRLSENDLDLHLKKGERKN